MRERFTLGLRRTAGCALAAAIALSTTDAYAQTAYYSDRTAWQLAAGGVSQNYGFEGLAAEFQPDSMSFAPGLTVTVTPGGVSGRGVYVNWFSWVFGDGSSILAGPLDKTFGGVNGGLGRITTFSWSTPTNAIGFDLGAFDPFGNFLGPRFTTCILFREGNFVGGFNPFISDFVGFTNGEAFDSMTIQSNDSQADYLAFDNITFGPANLGSSAPEPGAISLLAMGLGVAGLVTRRGRSIGGWRRAA